MEMYIPPARVNVGDVITKVTLNGETIPQPGELEVIDRVRNLVEGREMYQFFTKDGGGFVMDPNAVVHVRCSTV